MRVEINFLVVKLNQSFFFFFNCFAFVLFFFCFCKNDAANGQLDKVVWTSRSTFCVVFLFFVCMFLTVQVRGKCFQF